MIPRFVVFDAYALRDQNHVHEHLFIGLEIQVVLLGERVKCCSPHSAVPLILAIAMLA